MNIGVSSASVLRPVALVIRVFGQAFQRANADMLGPAVFTSQRAKREEQRQSAQEQALRNLHVLERRRTALRIEREILIAEIKQAHRQHSPVSLIEAELRGVVTEMLTIG